MPIPISPNAAIILRPRVLLSDVDLVQCAEAGVSEETEKAGQGMMLPRSGKLVARRATGIVPPQSRTLRVGQRDLIADEPPSHDLAC